MGYPTDRKNCHYIAENSEFDFDVSHIAGGWKETKIKNKCFPRSLVDAPMNNTVSLLWSVQSSQIGRGCSLRIHLWRVYTYPLGV